MQVKNILRGFDKFQSREQTGKKIIPGLKDFISNKCLVFGFPRWR